MKKAGVVVGLLTLITLCAGAMAADEPKTGRFSFQARTPEPVDRFIPLEIAMKGNFPGGSENVVLGVNIYWKTKNKNMLQGRSYTGLQPNLPRAGHSFSTFGYHNVPNDRPNPENIEMLVWNEGVYNPNNMDETFNNGCPPTLARNFYTQFYNFRFGKPYKLSGVYSDITCADAKKYVTVSEAPGDEDPDVALTAFSFSRSPNFCSRLGEFCNKERSRTVLIPSNKVEFLYVEIFAFDYSTYNGQNQEYYYTLPVTVIRFVPDSLFKENYMLVDYVYKYAPDADKFPGFNSPREVGYLSGVIFNYINEYDYSKSSAYLNYTRYNFDVLDKLKLELSFASAKVPEWDSPKQTGVKVVVDLEYMKRECVADKSQCQYPTRN